MELVRLPKTPEVTPDMWDIAVLPAGENEPVYDALEDAYLPRAETLERRGRLQEAADAYIDFANQLQNAGFLLKAATVKVKAAELYEKLGGYEVAELELIDVTETLLRCARILKDHSRDLGFETNIRATYPNVFTFMPYSKNGQVFPDFHDANLEKYTLEQYVTLCRVMHKAGHPDLAMTAMGICGTLSEEFKRKHYDPKYVQNYSFDEYRTAAYHSAIGHYGPFEDGNLRYKITTH